MNTTIKSVLDKIDTDHRYHVFWVLVVLMIGPAIYFFIVDGLFHLGFIWCGAALFLIDDLWDHWSTCHATFKVFRMIGIIVTAYTGMIYGLAAFEMIDDITLGVIYVRPISSVYAALVAGDVMFSKMRREKYKLTLTSMQESIEKVGSKDVQ